MMINKILDVIGKCDVQLTLEAFLICEEIVRVRVFVCVCVCVFGFNLNHVILYNGFH